jgi:hypothetical protein
MKDKRYKAVQKLIESGEIVHFDDVFQYIPRSIVAEDMGFNYRTLVGKISAPLRFTAGEIIQLANLIEIDPDILFKSISKEMDKKPSNIIRPEPD